MLQPTSFLVPLAFRATCPQEPKTTSDTPAGPAPAPGAAGATVPGAPQGGGPAPSPCGGPETLIYMGIFLALMYFMVLRPEQKRRKEQQALLSSVKQGDHVVTVGGMHGTVAKLTDKTVTLRIDSVNVTVDRVAIARVERDDAAPPARGS